jgi:hypothetical protein
MKIAILGCKGVKQNYTCPAEEMYNKSYIFSKQLEIIKKNYDKYYILSSKYGLITPDTIIEPYDLIFEPLNTNFTRGMGAGYNSAPRATKQYKQEWAEQVIPQLKQLKGNVDMWVGYLYYNLLKNHLPSNFRKVQVNSGKGVNKMKGMLNEIAPLTLSIDEMINQGLLKRAYPRNC